MARSSNTKQRTSLSPRSCQRFPRGGVRIERNEDMQTGFSLDNEEVIAAIKRAAIEFTSTDSEDLKVLVNYYRGEVSASIVHADGTSPLRMI